MASTSTLLPAILLISCLLPLFYLAEPRPELVHSHVAPSTQQGLDGSNPTLNTDGAIDCGGACEFRCSKSSRPNLCRRACGTCCVRCNCVPSGTYGNHNMCPCYAALTTHDGRPKCP